MQMTAAKGSTEPKHPHAAGRGSSLPNVLSEKLQFFMRGSIAVAEQELCEPTHLYPRFRSSKLVFDYEAFVDSPLAAYRAQRHLLCPWGQPKGEAIWRASKTP
ncbi:Unannotated [Lentimonas sp. CC4]|nr:Unannotated [Lentimonas sp. CC4]